MSLNATGERCRIFFYFNSHNSPFIKKNNKISFCFFKVIRCLFFAVPVALRICLYEIRLLADNVPDGKHIVTGDIRKLSARLYREIKDKTIDNVFSLCEELLEEHSRGLDVIAFDWAYRAKGQYSEDMYEIFYGWLKKYVHGWGGCDDFCTHAFGELLRRYKSLFSKVMEWTKDEDYWVRRASAVILIPAILHKEYMSKIE